MTYNEFITLKMGQEIRLFGEKYIVLKINQTRFCVDALQCEYDKPVLTISDTPVRRVMTVGGDLLIGEGTIIKRKD